jgi:hypothetical protein
MRRTGGKLIAEPLACRLAVGLGFFGVIVPRWALDLLETPAYSAPA